MGAFGQMWKRARERLQQKARRQSSPKLSTYTIELLETRLLLSGEGLPELLPLAADPPMTVLSVEPTDAGIQIQFDQRRIVPWAGNMERSREGRAPTPYFAH